MPVKAMPWRYGETDAQASLGRYLGAESLPTRAAIRSAIEDEYQLRGHLPDVVIDVLRRMSGGANYVDACYAAMRAKQR